MVNTLSGSVSAYRKEIVKPRFIRIDEVMALLDVTRDEAMDIALAAGARYQLAKIILVHKERLMKFMKHFARVPSSNKIVEKKFVRIGEASMTYSIGHHRFIESLEKIKVYARGWLNYYGIASMKNNIDDINGWLYHRIRMCIWKQWKKPRTKVRNLIKMGVPKDLAMQAGNTRRGHWFATHTVAVNMAMTKERLINSGFYDLATAYQSVHVNY